MGHYLGTPNKEKISEEGAFGNMKFAASSMQGWRVSMEDAHVVEFNIAPDTHIFGVFDGHGGAEVAKFVAKYLVEEILKIESFQKGNYTEALSDVFVKMDEILMTPEGRKALSSFRQGHGSMFEVEQEVTAGCTAVVALLVKDQLYVANAGDSRCVIVKKGEAVALTEDHKPENLEEWNRIEKAGGVVQDGRINGRLNLSRAIGDFDYKGNNLLKATEQLVIPHPDIQKWTVTNDDDFLLLGCDGIWECLPPQQICDFISTKLKNKKTLKESIEDLLDYILAKDTQTGLGLDNMTCVVISLK